MQGKRSPCLLYPVLRSNGEWRVGNWEQEKMEGKSGGKIWREIWLVYVGECTLGTVLWLLYVGKCTLGDTDFTCLEGQKLVLLLLQSPPQPAKPGRMNHKTWRDKITSISGRIIGHSIK